MSRIRLLALLSIVAMPVQSMAQAAPANELFIATGPTVFIPIGSFSDTAAPSLGLDIVGGHWLREWAALVLLFDYTFVTKQEDSPNQIDFAFYGLGIGARLRPPKARLLQPFVEGLAGVHTTRTTEDGFVASDSALLLKFAAGVSIPLNTAFELGAKGGYRYAMSTDKDITDIGGAAVEAFVSAQF